MATLNVTALTQSEGMSQIVCVVNNSANGLLTAGLVIALFFIMILILKKWDFIKAFIVSSWTCFIISLLMTSIACPDGSKWLNIYYALVFLLMTALSAIYLWTTDE